MPEITLQNPTTAPFKEQLNLGTELYLQYSTRTFWHQKRNVLAESPDNHNSSASKNLTYTYQDSWFNTKLKSRTEGAFKILGKGKDGKLESWMIETEWGIEDSSGESRPDWRASWIVLYFPAVGVQVSDPSVGLDILCNRSEQLQKETVEDIKAAIQKIYYLIDEFGTPDLHHVPNDGAREREAEKKDVERQKKIPKTGPEAGISPNLRYPEEEEEEEKKCGLQ
ncbi:hypothetical protein G7Y89_g8773 [Cudoniella acicularis]|uniref:Uncharacterized protein n=1 Tax=Cudoniella acicularis TaxID=354080 RepID=A0A8H4RGW9_9HELO|nr:hypothetical protein G7Y89_g8773 [Cudoniella acicularis]